MAETPSVIISYCPKCRWLLRSAWMAQELLSTFEEHRIEVTLRPAPEAGMFRIEMDGDWIWDRVRDGGFPEIKELKRRTRDRIAPEQDLGHTEHGGKREGSSEGTNAG